MYTYRDGDRELRVWLEPELTMIQREGAFEPGDSQAIRAGNGIIVATGAASTGGQPVFRSDSGTLMALPGGVILILAADWTAEQVATFFSANEIDTTRVSRLAPLRNGFVVETAAGFPALDLANALAGLDGVEVSSPNWWRERVDK